LLNKFDSTTEQLENSWTTGHGNLRLHLQLPKIYTVVHKKRATLFSVAIPAFLVDILNFSTNGNRNKYSTLQPTYFMA